MVISSSNFRNQFSERFRWDFTASMGLICLAALPVFFSIGCDRQMPGSQTSGNGVSVNSRSTNAIDRSSASIASGPSAFELAKQAVARQDWPAASKQIGMAMLATPDDPEVLQLAADIAFSNREIEQAVALIVNSTVADGYERPEYVHRAMIACLSVGKIYEAIDLLTAVIERFPERDEVRRDLFDFLMNVEERHRALPHGRILIKRRKFDQTLMFSMGTNEQRDLEPSSMKTLLKRNPTDERLRIATLRVRFDKGLWDGFEDRAKRILKHSPNNLPTLLLLGRYFTATDQFDRIPEWSAGLAGAAVKENWQYWLVWGDWAVSQGDYRGAARAYWESTRRNLNVAEVVGKLGTCLQVLSEDEGFDRQTVSEVQQRGELLMRFLQEKERYYKLGQSSNEAVADMASTLARLGRYWEAEAWAALAVAKPDEDIEQAKQVRSEIVANLKASNPPWQEVVGHPFVTLDLSHLPLPSVDNQSSGSLATKDSNFSPSTRPLLENQAKLRGIQHRFAPAVIGDAGVPTYAQMESGGCAIDYDLDGWPDLYIGAARGKPPVKSSQPNYLYRNCDGQFVDVTDNSETGDKGFTQGVTFGDLNEDGFSDLVVLNYGVDQIYLNNGDGTFSSEPSWLPADDSPGWSTCGSIADLNGDGLSDMIRTHYCAGFDAVNVPCFDEGSGFEGPCLPTKFPALADSFFEGRPSGGFHDMTQQWSAIPTDSGRGLGMVTANLDGKPGLEVFVANDMTTNHFWTTTKDENDAFSLSESSALRGLACNARFQSQACMGIAAADLDEDGDIDLFVTNFEGEYNTFFEQQRPGIWTDVTLQRGIRDTSFPFVGFGCQAIDFDNDGHLEIVLANGHVYKYVDEPITYQQNMQILYRKTPSKWDAFDFKDDSGYVTAPHVGRALWTLDCNRDGQVDFAVTHQTEPFALLVNQTENGQAHDTLRLRLVGSQSSRDPVGSTVRIQFGDFKRTSIWSTGDGFYCANEKVLHFGLGRETAQNQKQGIAEVEWPDGSVQSFEVSPNGEYLIVQGEQEAFLLMEK